MELTWFGRPHRAQLYADCKQAPTPFGCACFFCDEEILIGDDGIMDSGSNPFHRECWLRLLVGSIAHQRRRCGCYLPESLAESDESEGFTRREMAKRALAYYEENVDG